MIRLGLFSFYSMGLGKPICEIYYKIKEKKFGEKTF